MNPPKVSYVVIGKNEAEHLAACLASVREQHQQPAHEILYVDSGSTDGSVEIARNVPGVRVIVLDDPKPSAAKARNLGWRESRGEFVHFVDGDAALTPYWITHALSAMQDQLVGAVFGGLRERHPERSLYNRFADLDWPHLAGVTDTFGGIVLVRRKALELCGAFDTSIRSGEEPELALRFVRRGFSILQLPVLMATHDLGFTRFSQYWRRNVLVGWAYAERAARIREGGQSALYERSTKSHAILVGAALLVVFGVLVSFRVLLLGIGLGMLDLLRLAHANRRRTRSWKHAFQYALHLRFVPLPFAIGARWWRRERRKRGSDDSQASPATA